ncbi:MAG TPA: sugar ABC transporter permease [Armatimonadota bacterium]|jgi:ABC-type sugar transport system permease subunit
MTTTTPRKYRRSAAERREARAAYGFLAPAMALFVVFVFIPVVAALYLSFTRYDIFHQPLWVGMDNYRALVHDEVFRQSLANTAYYAACTIIPGMSLSLLLALILNAKLRGITFYRAAYYLPVVTSLVAVAMIWMWMFQPASGLINQTLANAWEPMVRWLGHAMETLSFGHLGHAWASYATAQPSWLGTPDGPKLFGTFPLSLTLRSLVIVALWSGLGWNMVIYLAGLQGIPVELYESAILDGAGPWARFRHVTWPLLKPTTFFIFVTSVIGASQVFGTVYVMTNGGPNNTTTTIVHQIFQNAFAFLKMGYASAMAFVLFLIIFAISMFNWVFLKGDVEYS